MSASASCLPSLVKPFSHLRLPAPHQLLQRRDVEVAVVEMRLELRHPAREEAPVLADRVAAHRRDVRRHVLRAGTPAPAPRPRASVSARGAHLVDQAGLLVRALVPGVHRLEHLVGLVQHQHRPLGDQASSASVTSIAISMMRSVSGLQPGHLHVDPDEVVGIARACFILSRREQRLAPGSSSPRSPPPPRRACGWRAPDAPRARAPRRGAADLRRDDPARRAPEGRRLHRRQGHAWACSTSLLDAVVLLALTLGGLVQWLAVQWARLLPARPLLARHRADRLGVRAAVG